MHITGPQEREKTMSPAGVAAGFALSAVAVVFAGVHLARSGDVIALRTRLGGLWVGSVFLAVATSLPELATDVAAVRMGAPDIAVGDLFGSSMANMLILALLSLLPGSALFERATLENGLAATLAITLTATAAFFLLLRSPVTIFGLGLGSIVIVVAYLAGTRTILKNDRIARQAAEADGEGRPADLSGAPSLRHAVLVFLGSSIAILIAAPLFAASAKGVAELTGLSTSFVGTWLVGLATSLPELVASLAAVRIGASDMAVGNLFGSNALNMAIFAPLDVAGGGEPLLGAVSEAHALAALVGIALMALGHAALHYRAPGRLLRLEPGGAMMVLLYFSGLVLIFLRSGRA